MPGRKGMCNTTCQYTMLICDWHYSHNENELYNTAQAKPMKLPTTTCLTQWTNSRKTTNSYALLAKSKNSISSRSTLTFTKTVLSHAKVSNVKSYQNQSINQQDSPNGPKLEKFVAYTNLEQEIDIKYFDNGHLGIIPKKAHPTNARFNLHYPENQSTTLPSRSITKIDLKIANNSEKSYMIESKEKIAQAIFLLLVKIGKFVPVENCEELIQTIRGTFGFKLTRKGIEANFIEMPKEKNELIRNKWSIMLMPYRKSEIKIKRTIKDINLIFEPHSETCQQFSIRLTNFFIPADKTQWIKIPITNTIEELIYIPENTIMGYLGTELENVSIPQKILNFPEIALYCELTLIKWQQLLECYQFMPEELAKLNIRTMDPDQHITTNIQELRRDQKPPVTFGALPQKQHSKNNFKVVTTPDTTILEYYQSIYTHCKQRFNILDGIEVVKKSVYQYIENCINNYLFGNYNISEVRSNLYNNLIHYSQLGTEDLNSETLATYFQELNFNIIKYYEETYPVQFQYSIDFESETKTSNKSKQKLKQYSKTTPNTPILPKTTPKHLQTPEQGTTANEENDSEISEEESINSENEKNEIIAYIAKISEFNGKDIETSPQEWLDQVTKAEDANRWNAAKMLRTIPYFLKRTAGKWFENLTTPFNDWTAFKTAFLEQFTDNNTLITL
ncbi:hypothetical protein G9A89_011447 [Geosiphon pyriformis]|nr:hypothetical protein G9A89_011447 [Geosiphon pyriformis]